MILEKLGHIFSIYQRRFLSIFYSACGSFVGHIIHFFTGWALFYCVFMTLLGHIFLCMWAVSQGVSLHFSLYQCRFFFSKPVPFPVHFFFYMSAFVVSWTFCSLQKWLFLGIFFSIYLSLLFLRFIEISFQDKCDANV